MLIIRMLNCIDAEPGIVTLSQWLSGAPDSHDVAGHRPATSSVHYTTNCNTQSSAPEDG